MDERTIGEILAITKANNKMLNSIPCAAHGERLTKVETQIANQDRQEDLSNTRSVGRWSKTNVIVAIAAVFISFLAVGAGIVIAITRGG